MLLIEKYSNGIIRNQIKKKLQGTKKNTPLRITQNLIKNGKGVKTSENGSVAPVRQKFKSTIIFNSKPSETQFI